MYDVQSIFRVVKELITQQFLVGAPVSTKKGLIFYFSLAHQNTNLRATATYNNPK